MLFDAVVDNTGFKKKIFNSPEVFFLNWTFGFLATVSSLAALVWTPSGLLTSAFEFCTCSYYFKCNILCELLLPHLGIYSLHNIYPVFLFFYLLPLCVCVSACMFCLVCAGRHMGCEWACAFFSCMCAVWARVCTFVYLEWMRVLLIPFLFDTFNVLFLVNMFSCTAA